MKSLEILKVFDRAENTSCGISCAAAAASGLSAIMGLFHGMMILMYLCPGRTTSGFAASGRRKWMVPNMHSADCYLRSMLRQPYPTRKPLSSRSGRRIWISIMVCLDILVLDGCPDNRILRKLQILCALIFQIFLQEPPTSKGKALDGSAGPLSGSPRRDVSVCGGWRKS